MTKVIEDEKQRVEGDDAIAIIWIMNLSTSTDLNRVDKFNRLHPAAQGQTLEPGARERKASSRRPSLLGDLFSLYNHEQLKSSTQLRAAITHSPSSAPVGPSPSPLPLTPSSVPTPAGPNTTVCKKCREDGPSCTLDSQCPRYCVGGTAFPNRTCTMNSDCPNTKGDKGICQFTPGTCSEAACPTPSPTLVPTAQRNCTVECVFSGTDCTITPSETCDDDSKTIQAALESLQPFSSLLLSGSFIIKTTIYLPSYIYWILDGTMTLGDNATLDEVGFVNVTEGIDATRPTTITENAGGATSITMSGGTYYGTAENNLGTVRFIKFVAVTNSSFRDMTIKNVGHDSFSLGPESSYNECRNLNGKAAGGNALTDKGSYNKWYDCIAEDCASDGFTIKCRYSEFYRCIGRNNTVRALVHTHARMAPPKLVPSERRSSVTSFMPARLMVTFARGFRRI